ncbi:MAG: 30S ribosomal protein S12 methylthiotransferase RimO [Treponema sp.]|nr:30S ribosomal protein S12 methylthiotransferase RimO [Treponema sp.]
MDQHGCAKNQTDGELIAGFLKEAGLEYSDQASEADFIIVNSCGFIESAKKESINAVYSIRQNYPRAKIILAGCLAQRYAKELQESMPELDGIFGNGDLSKIAEYIKNCGKQKLADHTSFEQKGICEGKRPLIFNYKASAYVKITEGCSNNCSFCAIPLIRGPVRSRRVSSIIKEIKGLIQNGVYEINLIGQDLAAFTAPEAEGNALKYLLSQISLLKGDFVVRTLYIHPDHFDTDILELYKKDKRLLPYFDIPFQSGDDQIIRAMNRVGPAQKYVKTIEKIRKELPEAVLRTTFLTGFPGETDSAFENTKKFLIDINPLWSGCFPYSREEGTPAWSFKPRVPAKLARQRAQELEQLQSELTTAKLKDYVSREFDVLIEEVIASEEEGLAIGRAWFEAPEVDGCAVVRYERDDKAECSAIKEGNVVRVVCLACTGVDLDCRFKALVRQFKESDRVSFVTEK